MSIPLNVRFIPDHRILLLDGDSDKSETYNLKLASSKIFNHEITESDFGRLLRSIGLRTWVMLFVRIVEKRSSRIGYLKVNSEDLRQKLKMTPSQFNEQIKRGGINFTSIVINRLLNLPISEETQLHTLNVLNKEVKKLGDEHQTLLAQWVNEKGNSLANCHPPRKGTRIVFKIGDEFSVGTFIQTDELKKKKATIQIDKNNYIEVATKDVFIVE